MARKLFLGVLSMIFGLSLLSTSCTAVSNISNKLQSNDIATLGDNGVGNSIYVSVGDGHYSYLLYVKLKPTHSAIAGTVYDVDLYENGKYRDTTQIIFTQPIINIQGIETVVFPATQNEWDAYFMEDISNIFSVKVHAPITTTTKTTNIVNLTSTIPAHSSPTSSTQPTFSIIYPKGGESWHVGDTVNITWISSNLPKNAPLSIFLISPNGSGVDIIGNAESVPNTGSYSWTIPRSISGTSIVGINGRIRIAASGIHSYCPESGYFTITN